MSERDTIRGVQFELVRYIHYKYSTLPHGISINIAPKLGIFPEAEGNIHTEGAILLIFHKERLNIHLFYYIG